MRPSDIHIFTRSPVSGYEKKASTTTPVVIKLEIPEGKPEIVKTIVEQVKETLVKTPVEAATSPLHVSIKSTTVSPSGAVPAATQQSVFSNKNIPQSLYDSIQQVIAQHLFQQLSKDTTSKATTTTTTSTTTTTTTESPPTSIEIDDITTFQPTVTESTSSTASHSLYEHVSGSHYYNVTDPAGSWPYQPWFQPPVYPSPYYPQPVYAHPPLNQTNQYFPYPQYPYGQWASPQASNYSNAFAGWYEWAYGQNPAIPTVASPLPAASTINETVSKLPASFVVTITTTAAPPTTAAPSATTLPPVSTSTPYPTTIHVKEIERITTKHFVPEPSAPITSTSPRESAAFDILRTKTTQAPETPQIQVYIVQGPNGPQVETKTLNRKDGQKQPNVQVYVIDEHSKKPYTYGQQQASSHTRAPVVESFKPQSNPYYQYAHTNYQSEESQIKIQTTMAPTDILYAKEEAYDNKYNSYRDLEYEDEDGTVASSGGVSETRSPYNQFLPSSKIQSLHNIYNSQSFPGLRNFTDGSVPESACTRPGLFQHPNDCNKFYECYFDRFVNKFTLHLFECPVKLAFDSRIVGCSGPTDPTVCVQY